MGGLSFAGSQLLAIVSVSLWGRLNAKGSPGDIGVKACFWVTSDRFLCRALQSDPYPMPWGSCCITLPENVRLGIIEGGGYFSPPQIEFIWKQTPYVWDILRQHFHLLLASCACENHADVLLFWVFLIPGWMSSHEQASAWQCLWSSVVPLLYLQHTVPRKHIGRKKSLHVNCIEA